MNDNNKILCDAQACMVRAQKHLLSVTLVSADSGAVKAQVSTLTDLIMELHQIRMSLLGLKVGPENPKNLPD